MTGRGPTASEPIVPVTAETLREALSHLAGGVVIVTTRGKDGDPRGMTATAVCSVSLEPPLVMACLDTRAATHAAVAESGIFALNLLPDSEEELARRFAVSAPGKFVDLDVSSGQTGAPLLDGALAFCDCAVVRSVPAGDHTIFIGRVEDAGAYPSRGRPAGPLLYYRGRYASVEGR